jgi:predicted nuclease of predicted toxin-antitoxin system
VRFLIDECLSVELTGVANEAGFEAHHVAHRGLAGAKDHQLRPVLLDEHFTLVTNNGRDFLKLLAEVELHPGLVIVIPNVRIAAQAALFRAALEFFQGREDLEELINKVLEVHAEDDVRVYDLPKGLTEPEADAVGEDASGEDPSGSLQS